MKWNGFLILSSQPAMRPCHTIAGSLFVALTLAAKPALAGMPMVGFSELAGLRLEAISFFLFVLVLSAAAVQWLWNRLAKDFVKLPRLNYPRAFGLVSLWGLLFVVVLTMISGARELMTPGAWRQNGLTFQLDDKSPVTGNDVDSKAAIAAELLAERRLNLAELNERLVKYANDHAGRFPDSPESSDIKDIFWQLPDPSGLCYVYVPGRTTADHGLPLAYEPSLYDGDPLVLLVGGEIVTLPRSRIEQSLQALAEGP